MKHLVHVFLLGFVLLWLSACAGRPPEGQNTAAATQTASPTQTASATQTVSPIPTALPTLTVTPTVTLSPTQTVSATQTVSPTVSAYPAAESVPVYTYEIVNTYPHDPQAFTQGLVYVPQETFFYEGTGLHGRSSLRKVDLETGEVLQIHQLPDELFGEGITLFGDRIIQITWQSRRGFVYDAESFQVLQEFNYTTEGWGITHDGRRLIVSDGTANLYFWDPETLAEIGRVEVHDGRGPVARLNELEYVRGEVYANVWQTDRIARIDPQDGRVLAWIDLAGLLDPAQAAQPVDVLNGIAYDPEQDRLFVTGKLWPTLFEIWLVPAE